MSDQPSPPPAKPKPGSLRDRIAAFEKSSTPAATPGPPPPRPKPAGFGSWKPKPPSPPSSPPATATGNSPAATSSSNAPPTLPKPTGMSASDAKESISKGGSLKERMAALQGRGGFGAPPPPVAPKPTLERPKWKPPPVVHAPVDDDDDQGAGSSTTRPAVVPTGVSVANMAGIAAAVERTISPPSVSKSPESMATQDAVEGGDGVSGAVSGSSGNVEGAEEAEKVVDEEEEERQRRAAIAARMARLGGARVGMAPPLFGPKPPVRRPTQDEPPKEVAKAPESKVEEQPMVASPPLEAASAVPLPPSDHTSPAPSDHVRSPEIPPARKSSDSVSVLSAEPAESHAAPKPPASMPVPAVPRRTGPPRRRAPKPSASTDVIEEKVEEKVPDVLDATSTPGVEDEPPKPTDEDVTPQTEATKDISPAVENVSPPAAVDPDQADLYLKATDTLLSASQDETATEPEHTPPTEHVITPVSPDEDTEDVEAVSPPVPAPQPIPPVQAASEDEQPLHSDPDQPPAEDQPPTVGPVEEVKEETAATVAPEESEEDEEARRKRVSERLAKMGGVNPFALPPQRKSSVGSAVSVSSPPLPPTSPPLPVLQPNIHEEMTDAAQGSQEDDYPQSPISPEPSKPAATAPPQSPPAEDKAADALSDEDDRSVYDDEPQSNVNPSAPSNENDEGTNPFAALLANSPPAPPPLPPSRPHVRKFSYADDEESEYGSGHASPLPPSGRPGATPASPDRDTHANQERRRASDASSGLGASVSSIPGPPPTNTQHYQHQNPAQPPRRLVPQTPAESEEEQEQDSDEDADSQLASSHLFVPPPVPPSGLPYVPTRLRSQPPEDDGNGSESDAPLPVLHRRSKTAESLERERQKEKEKSNLGKEPLTSTWDDREDDEEEGESGSDHGGEALPIPPRSVPAPPPVPLGTRPTSIASPPRNIPPRPVSRVPDVPSTSPPASMSHDAPTLSVEGGEILDEDEGDPIDPAFHSPSRRGSFSSLLPPSAPAEGSSSPSHLSPTPPLPIPPTPVQTSSVDNPFGPVAQSPLPPARSPPQVTTPPVESEQEDPEQARRKTIAERMAKLGGIKFGAAPPLPGVRPPMPRRQDSERSEPVVEKDATAAATDNAEAEEGEATPDTSEAPRELTEEEEERARKERIAAKLAGMGGMRIGMMPMGMGMGMGVRPKSHVLRDEDVGVSAGVSSSPPAVSPPVRAVPPTRPPPSRLPPPPTQPPPAHYDSDKASDDGVKVEVEESDIEEVKYEDAEDVEEGEAPDEEEEDEAPPPIPSRSSRPITIHRQGSVDKPVSPPLPPGRPPVPSGIFRRPTATATQPQSSPQAHRAPTSEYVMVEEPSSHHESDRNEEDDAPPPPPPARPATHRLPPSSSRNTMTYPPPPLPDTQTQTSGGDNSLTSQWELPSIPTSTLDFGGGVGGGSDLSMSWTDAGESLPAAHQARLQQQQKARLSLGSDNASLSVGSPKVPQSPPATSSSFQAPPSVPPSAGLTSPSVAQSQRERRLSGDDLMVVWGRVGVQLCEVATTLYEKSKKQLIGDGTYVGFIESVLQSVPNAACDPVANDWGYLIYHQNGSSVLKRASEIMPGDIVEISDGKLKGHKGLQTYHQNVGGGGDVLVGVVGEFEAKKTKIRVFHANQHVGQQTVESVSYRLEDLKSGSVKVYRVLEIEA